MDPKWREILEKIERGELTPEEGASRMADGNRQNIYRLYQQSMERTDYFEMFQFKGALRVLATLRLMKRDAEADAPAALTSCP